MQSSVPVALCCLPRVWMGDEPNGGVQGGRAAFGAGGPPVVRVRGRDSARALLQAQNPEKKKTLKKKKTQR
jgi:hypothetical protein